MVNVKQMDESVLKKALEELRTERLQNVNERIQEYQSIPIPPALQCDEQELRMMYQRSRRKYIQIGYRRMPAVAVALLVILIMSLITGLTVVAHRADIVKWFTQNNSVYETIDFQTSDETVDQLVTLYKPTYIPYGFQQEYEEKQSSGYAVGYIKGDDYIDYSQKPLNGTGMLVDSEGMDITQIEIHGCKAKIYTKKSRTIIVWTDDQCIYTVLGSVSKSTIKKIAESVKEAEK